MFYKFVSLSNLVTQPCRHPHFKILSLILTHHWKRTLKLRRQTLKWVTRTFHCIL